MFTLSATLINKVSAALKRSLVVWPLYLLLLIYFIFSIATFRDYGVTLDESRQYHWGSVMMSYYQRANTFRNTILSTANQEEKLIRHTPIMSKYYSGYPALLSYFNKNGTYERYHFYNLMFASLVIVASYSLLYKATKDKYLSILGPLFIFLTPRFFGHIPANPKDMPFAVVYFLGLWAIYFSSYIKNNYLRIFFLGFFFYLAQSLRLIGFSIYIVYVIFLLVDRKNVVDSLRKTFIDRTLELVLMAIVSMFLTLITWPYLGSNFIPNLFELFGSSASFAEWDNAMLFMGKFYTVDSRPWYYLFVFIFVTMPSFLVLNFVVAVSKLRKNRLYLLFLSALLVNLGIYLVTQPNIYNGLRHFLFLLPIISFIASLGMIWVTKHYKKKVYYLLSNVVLIGVVVNTLINLHPYEYTYFNPVIVPYYRAQYHFEIDYWGAAYKEGTEWLINNEEVKHKKVGFCNSSAVIEYFSRGKFELVRNYGDADYIICDNDRYGESVPGEVVYKVERYGVILLVVTKI